jgi:outer membrane receptor protein involved in Fe transport
MARRFIPIVLLLSVFIVSSARAQDARSPTLSGSVVDILGAPVVRATIVVAAADGTIHRTDTDSTGAFSIRNLPGGRTTVTVDAPLFETIVHTVTLSDNAQPLRVALRPAGFSEAVIVRAARVETRNRETPMSVDVIDRTDLERTVAADLTDALKKNAGVDVIQYSGALSGIGIRGFRPQTSGINKRSLLLVDGRPSGITNLATLMLDDVERIEVLKGPASAVYGSSAMGGVVNVITRQSRGKIGGAVL